jgi:hypothetical protein
MFTDLHVKFGIPSTPQKIFLLIDRGACFFTWKALFAQTAGAHVGIIVDVHKEYSQQFQQLQIEGYKTDVVIPIVVVSKDTGLLAKAALRHFGQGQVTATFAEMPKIPLKQVRVVLASVSPLVMPIDA